MPEHNSLLFDLLTFAISGFFLLIHFKATQRPLIVCVIVGIVGLVPISLLTVNFFNWGLTPGTQAPPILVYVEICTWFATGLYVSISDLLLLSAGHLTKWRGTKWVKELDYAYLLLASAGVLLAINRIEFASEKFGLKENFTPFLLVAALTIRAIKTRAEIANWALRHPTDSIVARADEWADNDGVVTR